MADPRPEANPRRHNCWSIRCDWCPDVPDHRDYLADDPRVTVALSRLPKRRMSSEELDRVDAREYAVLAPARNVQVNSSVETVAAMIEHFERRASGRALELSRGFLDQASRRCAAATGRVVTLRTVLKAARRCGVPSERYFPTQESGTEPDPLAHCFAHNLTSIRYFRLDSPSGAGEETLRRLKSFLAAGFPVAFGFAVSNAGGDRQHVWCPTAADDSLGGAAAIALGFDDRLRIRSDRGALLIRGWWGPWQNGPEYGWLPYAFVRRRLAVDFWTLLKRAWMRSGEFTTPGL